MALDSKRDANAALTATLAASAMMLHQVAGKAARDALFLSNFGVEALPKMMITASIASIVLVLGSSRLMAAIGPARLVPSAFLASAILILAEWSIFRSAPEFASVLLYLHTVAIGACLGSLFWSLLNERFDPRTAKQLIGRITTGGTIGALIGGVVAERIGAGEGVSLVFPVLALTHFVSALLLHRSANGMSKQSHAPDAPEKGSDDMHKERGFLIRIGGLVFVTTMSAALIDYVVKAEASAHYSSGPALLRFFALLYTSIGVASFLVQATLSRRILERFGLNRAVAALPAVGLLGSLACLFAPNLITITLARGLEAVTRGSVFRAGYEVLYTPLPQLTKRKAKSIIDVAVDRSAEIVAACLMTVLAAFGADVARIVPLIVTMLLGATGMYIAGRLRRGYVAALEARLFSRMLKASDLIAVDKLTRQTIAFMRPGNSPNLEESAVALMELASRDPVRVRTAIEGQLRIDATFASGLIPLLGNLELETMVSDALRASLPRTTGLLLDVVLDPDADPIVRRKVAHVITSAAQDDPRTLDGFFAGLASGKSEIRSTSARALARIHEEHPTIEFDRGRVERAVLAAASPDKKTIELAPDESAGDVEVIDKSLRHIFTLLTLIHTKEPLDLAFRGLFTDDPMIRGTSLEYLESILSSEVFSVLEPALGRRDLSLAARTRSREEILDELMRAKHSMEVKRTPIQK